MKFFLVALLFCLNQAFATTYYVKANGGDGNGLNDENAWSYAKLNATQILAGDIVLLKRGDIFYGTLTACSGSSGNLINYGAYGTGANPKITGLTQLKSWKHLNGNVYYATLDATMLNLVTVNGMVKGMGRYPNTGYLNYESHTSNSSITDNQLANSSDWTGGEVVIRKYRWILDRHTITSHSGNTITYNVSEAYGNNNAYSPVNGNGYFIQNHISTLDQFGEWYYDVISKRLYMDFDGNNPSNYEVKASTISNNVLLNNNSNIIFENLDFEGGNIVGVSLINAQNIRFTRCNFLNQGGVSIYGHTLNSILIEECNIDNSLSNGIFFEYDANNCNVSNVVATNTSTIAGAGKSGDAVGIGLFVCGNNTVITKNKVINSGYNGIEFIGNNVLIEKNFVDTFCTVKDDGGGIYTYEADGVTNANRVIKNNIVLNAIGNFNGAEAYDYEAFGKAVGIYLDGNSNHTEVSNNTLAHGEWAGIFQNNNGYNQIQNNLVYDFAQQLFLLVGTVGTTRSMTVRDNTFIAKKMNQKSLFIQLYTNDDPTLFGNFSNNIYARPIDDVNTIAVNNEYSGGNGNSVMTLESWKKNYNQDLNSSKSLVVTDKVSNFRFDYNWTPSELEVSLNCFNLDVVNNTYISNISLPAYSGSVLIKAPIKPQIIINK